MSMNPSEFARKEEYEKAKAARKEEAEYEKAKALLEEIKPQVEALTRARDGGIRPYCYQCGRMTPPVLGEACQERPCGLEPIG